jgi:RNA polymerase sigma factor (sigma-70 family)
MARFSLIRSEDTRILEGIRRGDDLALGAMYRVCDAPVRRLVIGNNGTRDDADDVLQESLVVLWERVRSGRFEHTARLSTFVVGVARNLWLRRLARGGRERPDSDRIDASADPGESPLDAMISRERAGAVRRALRELGEPCRTLLLLFYWEQASMEEIAARLGFANAETAKARKYQCKKTLHHMLRVHERHH